MEQLGASMEGIAADAAKVLLAFIGGGLTLWLATRKQRAEYEDLKRTRRITGAKMVERTELLKSHADTLIRLKEKGLELQHLYEMVEYSKSGRLERAAVRRSNSEIETTVEEFY